MSADYIEYLEQKKTEIVSDHIRRCHDTELDEAEINWEIAQLRKQEGK